MDAHYSRRRPGQGADFDDSGGVDLVISAGDGTCTFASNAIPNHDFDVGGSFATPVSTQSVSYSLPAEPALAAASPS